MSLLGALWAGLIAFYVTADVAAQPADGSTPARELLNSERIEQAFGSYGIEVLETAGDIRLSNLYSLDGEDRIGRTFAVVRYPAAIAPEYEREHELIVNGGSIGAVFAANGWLVRKTHLHYGILPAGNRVAGLMQIPATTPIAVHVYLLEVERAAVRLPYVTIAEMHHPDYLGPRDLEPIYGAASARGHEDLVDAMLETARQHSTR